MTFYNYGGVSLSISLNLKLAPVPYTTTKWPIAVMLEVAPLLSTSLLAALQGLERITTAFWLLIIIIHMLNTMLVLQLMKWCNFCLSITATFTAEAIFFLP